MRGVQRTHEEFVKLVNSNSPSIEVVGQFKKTRDKIEVKCRICNTHYFPFAQELIKTIFRCKKCELIDKKRKFTEKISNINPNIIIKSEYQNIRTKVLCECLICGTEWKVTPSNLLNEHGCPTCAKESRRLFFCKGRDDFVKELKNISPSISIISDYTNAHTKIWCQCLVCNYKWQTTPHSLLKGSRCLNCASVSKGESRIMKVLDDMSIQYVQQKRFQDCRNIKPLPFDFFLPNYNLCIEYQGQQHYRSVGYFGGKDEFDLRRRRDEIKVKYCQDKKIDLLHIPYWQYNDIENIIKDVIQKKGD